MPDQQADSIRVVVADDQTEVRDGFRQILDAAAGLTVVGEASDGESALHSVELLRPDVLVVDIRMPRVDGLEVCRRIEAARREGRLATRVVVATTFDLDEYLTQALTHGAAGFLLKRSRPELLVEAVRVAVDGDTLVSPQLTVRLLSSPRLNPRHAHHTEVARLTARECDVAREVAAGSTNAEIAAALFITPGTVKTHLANIQDKLDVSNRVGIAAWAWAHGVATDLPAARRASRGGDPT
ncbi:MAG: response regulator [Nocardioidaceae bacterium]